MRQRQWLLVLAALFSVGAYILMSAMRGAVGFPLDDAWIHQVYARNLATRGEFAFFPGQPSAGSTSPLWAILLGTGYSLHIDSRVWTYLIGIVLLGASAIVASRLADHLFASCALPSAVSLSSFLFPLFLIFEWHLVWSAASGMEIPLFIFLSLILLERFYARASGLLLGLLAGLLVLTRPEGVVLGALVGVGCAFGHSEQSEGSPNRLARCFAVPHMTMATVLTYALAFAIVVAPYALFNLMVGGAIFPNTFYAKATEYAVLFERVPFVVRWLQLLFVPWVGAQILLLPGSLYAILALAFKRQWLALIPAAWWLLLPTVYALRLPVAYQHGRYEMPVIPFIVLYGIWGTAALLAHLRNWLVRTACVFSTIALLVAFWILGANAYAADVAIIDCEMVQTARWVVANTPADAMIGAHDIGALGYFYDRPFIDLAGLVTPEVIPFIRDEGRLREYLVLRQATFVVVFPDWYSTFASDPRFVPVHQANCAVTREAGGKNMVVYQLVR